MMIAPIMPGESLSPTRNLYMHIGRASFDFAGDRLRSRPTNIQSDRFVGKTCPYYRGVRAVMLR